MPTTHIANNTSHKFGVEVKWENSSDPFHVIEPRKSTAVVTGNSDVLVIVRNMDTGREIATRRVDPDRSVILSVVGGQCKIILQKHGAPDLFEIDPKDTW